MLGSGNCKPVRGSSLRSPKQTTFNQSYPFRSKAGDTTHRDAKPDLQMKPSPQSDSAARIEQRNSIGDSPVTAGVGGGVLTSDRDLMRFEDMRSAYIRLECLASRKISDLEAKCLKMTSAAKCSRERSLLTQKIDQLGRLCSDSSNPLDLKKPFEEVAISYWLLAKESSAMSRHLHAYVKSLLQGSEEPAVTSDGSESRKQLEQIARLKRELAAKDLANTMCVVQLNKLSGDVAGLLGQDLPAIQKYPELELPDLCKALTRAISRAAHDVDQCKPPKTPSSRGTASPAPDHFDQKWKDADELPRNRRAELCLEEVMFERDLARKQNSILQDITRDRLPDEQRTAIFERLYAKEESLKRQSEMTSEQRAVFEQERTEFEQRVAGYEHDLETLKGQSRQLAAILSIARIDAETNTTPQVTLDQCTGTPAISHSDSSADPMSPPVSTAVSKSTATDPPAKSLSKKISTDPSFFSASKSTSTDVFRLVNRGVDPIYRSTRDQGTTMDSESQLGPMMVSAAPQLPSYPRTYESPAKAKRYRDSALRKSITTRAGVAHTSTIANAEKVLEIAHKHLGAIERTWYNNTNKKLKDSITDRKGSITPCPDRLDSFPVTPKMVGEKMPLDGFNGQADEMWESMRLDGARSTMHFMPDDLSDLSFGSLACDFSALEMSLTKKDINIREDISGERQRVVKRRGDRIRTEAPTELKPFLSEEDEVDAGRPSDCQASIPQ